MKKQELVQLHRLLVLVTDEADVETPTYDEHGVGPASVHRAKGDHRDAVIALASDVSGSLAER